MTKKWIPYVLLVPQLLLGLIFVMGLITGITQSLGVIPAFGLTEPTLKYYKEILQEPEFVKSVLFSIYIATVSAVLAVVLGVAICGVMTSGRKTPTVWNRLVELPIIVPHVVVALFTVNLLSQSGLIARVCFALGLIEEQQQFIQILYGENGLGIILSYLWKEIPFVAYMVMTLMSKINGGLGEAAINLGASKLQTFFKITLPLCRNTILSSFLIVFTFALGAYELPAILGPTLPKALPILAHIQYTHPNLKNRPYAMALNGIIIIISVLCALLYYKLMKNSAEDLIKKGGNAHEES